MLDETALHEIRGRADAASSGPWKAFAGGRGYQSGSSFIMVGAAARVHG